MLIADKCSSLVHPGLDASRSNINNTYKNNNNNPSPNCHPTNTAPCIFLLSYISEGNPSIGTSDTQVTWVSPTTISLLFPWSLLVFIPNSSSHRHIESSGQTSSDTEWHPSKVRCVVLGATAGQFLGVGDGGFVARMWNFCSIYFL
jgi:hypothetical protein